jgi:hypothetical protein
MFTCYFDDSGGSDHGFTTVCGWVSTLESWRQYAQQWSILLAMYRLKYFTMKECAQRTGQFAGWPENQRQAFLRSACQIINLNARFGFASIVSHAEYQEVNKTYTLKEYTTNEYVLAGISTARQAYDWAAVNHPGVPIEFVFDQGTKGHGALSDLMKKELKCIPIFRSGREQDGLRPVTQLQAADFLAYEVRKVRKDDPNEILPIEQFRKTVRMLVSVENDWGQFTENDLIQLCERHPRIERRAIK